MMDREIKFRGKSYTDNKWHYGYYFCRFATPFSEERHEITDGAGLGWNCHAETVGQYTGLKDKNGREIYEGDVVKGHGFGGTYRIRFWGGDATFGGESAPYNGIKGAGTQTIGLNNASDWIEVISNIHDNPTLLEGREE